MASLLSAITTLGPRRAATIARRRLKRAVLEHDPWFDTDHTCPDNAILIGGCGRSGTTLLREVLNRHPNIICGPETTILCDLPNPTRLSVMWDIPRRDVESMIAASPSIVRFAETFFRAAATAQNKPRWADKTPRNVQVIPRLLAWFPNARFIHVVRDGRDVVCSLRNHPKTTIRHAKIVPANNDTPIRRCAQRWLDDTSLGLVFKGHPRCTEIRYEDLVDDPHNTVKRLCDFIGEDFDPAMIDAGASADAKPGRLMNNPAADKPIHRSSHGRWRRDLSPDEARDVVRIAGELLITLGYTPDHSWANEVNA